MQGQLKGDGARLKGADQYTVAADAVIAACRGVMCWEGRGLPALSHANMQHNVTEACVPDVDISDL